MIINLKAILEKAENMQIFSPIALDILKTLDLKNTTPADLEKKINLDPVLTMRILKVSNSAYYGFMQKIENISRAIVVLGLDTVKSVIMAVTAQSAINNNINPKYSNYLWLHSLSTAIISKEIAIQNKFENPERYFIFGLFHDIGKIFAAVSIETYFETILQRSNDSKSAFFRAERMSLETDHAAIGAIIAEKWQLPPALLDVISSHHEPMKCKFENKRYVNTIFAANIISHKAVENIIPVIDEPIPNAIMLYLNLTPEKIAQMKNTIGDIIKKFATAA